MSVVIASPEIAPYAKTGGLGDVMGSLPGVLAGLGADVSLIMPAYRSVLEGDYAIDDTGIRITAPVSDRRQAASILRTITRDRVPVSFVRADRYFNREHLYGSPDGDYPDNAERFAFFCRAILEVLRRQPPQILHANDWETALAITFLKTQPHLYPEIVSVKTVLTIHNLGYQGIFDPSYWHHLNLDWGLFNSRNLEFYGKINFLKGGIVHADAITTVSPSYAAEIMTPEQGFGLEGVFQERAAKLFGISNGVDYHIWNPETDPYVTENYSREDLSGKKLCKHDLQAHFHLMQDASVPVIGMVTRLSAQKGLDLVQEGLGELMARNCQLVILGSGDRSIQEAFGKWPSLYPGRVGVEIGFSEALAHRVIAGADLLLMPSRYEPGGLTQLYGLRYGTVPVVRATGGLKDTVTEFCPDSGAGNGFLFDKYDVCSLLEAVDRAIAVYRGPQSAWEKLVVNGMSDDFSWTRSARSYLDLYRSLLATT